MLEYSEKELEELSKRLDLVLSAVKEEVIRAATKFGKITSRHEGASIIHEEYDEFWNEVKRNAPINQITEGVQLSAMAALYVATFGEQAFPIKQAGEESK